MNAKPTLSEQIAAPGATVAPGIYDALSAVLAEQAGFGATYLSGASIAYCRFGRPDIGLVGMSEVAATLSRRQGAGRPAGDRRCRYRLWQRAECDAHRAPFRAQWRRRDPDWRTRPFPSAAGTCDGKTLVSRGEMVGKIKAALDARQDPRR